VGRGRGLRAARAPFRAPLRAAAGHMARGRRLRLRVSAPRKDGCVRPEPAADARGGRRGRGARVRSVRPARVELTHSLLPGTSAGSAGALPSVWASECCSWPVIVPRLGPVRAVSRGARARGGRRGRFSAAECHGGVKVKLRDRREGALGAPRRGRGRRVSWTPGGVKAHAGGQGAGPAAPRRPRGAAPLDWPTATRRADGAPAPRPARPAAGRAPGGGGRGPRPSREGHRRAAGG
jgi:hypothetical protein